MGSAAGRKFPLYVDSLLHLVLRFLVAMLSMFKDTLFQFISGSLCFSWEGGEDVEVFVYDVVYWYIFVEWELLGNKGDFANVLIVAANIFGDVWQNLFPSF